MDSATLERQVVDRYDHLPLAQIFRRNAEPEIANRVARAIVKEARELQLAPSLLAGVLLTENARLEPRAVSSGGAIGLMQVMRFHAGVFDCDSDDLLQVEANICHGARVFAGYLKRTKDVPAHCCATMVASGAELRPAAGAIPPRFFTRRTRSGNSCSTICPPSGSRLPSSTPTE